MATPVPPLGDTALAGLRVIDLGTFIGGPFCGTLLAEFGADVIKIELPGVGDPMRHWADGARTGQHSLFWSQEGRNKKAVTVNLRVPEGQQIIKDLVKHSDILVENYQPGTVEKWNLGYEDLRAVNPGIIMVRVSGYGQTGPYSHKPGFARVAQAFGGLAYLAGEPGGPPLTPGSTTIADYCTGLFAAFGALVAKNYRDRTGEGQVVDLALYESIFRIMDNLGVVYSHSGEVREAVGMGTPYAVPHGHFPTRDDKWVAIACTNDRMWSRLCAAMDRAELANDPRYATATDRIGRRTEVDALVTEFTRQLPRRELVDLLDEHEVPVGPVYNVADIFADPHYWERGSLVKVDDPIFGPLTMPSIVPNLSRSPGRIERLGPPEIGQDTDAVLSEVLGYTAERIAELRSRGVI